MPHLHLPLDHTDADLVLAANLAEIVGSEDLYVAWSHESGAGAVPPSSTPRRSVRGWRAESWMTWWWPRFWRRWRRWPWS